VRIKFSGDRAVAVGADIIITPVVTVIAIVAIFVFLIATAFLDTIAVL
jgi:hypothetical protein